MGVGLARQIDHTPLPAESETVVGRAKVSQTRVTQIILVGDEEDNRDTLAETLARAGYQVVIAGGCANALRAIKTCANTPWCIDLLLTDHTMSDMTGEELIDQLAREGVTLPTVIIFEGTDEPQGNGRIKYIRKPFATDEIVDLIRHILQSEDAAPVQH